MGGPAGRHLVVTNHCVLWRKSGTPPLMQRLLFPLERRALRHPRCISLAVSDDITAQLRQVKPKSIERVAGFFFAPAQQAGDIAPLDRGRPDSRRFDEVEHTRQRALEV